MEIVKVLRAPKGEPSSIIIKKTYFNLMHCALMSKYIQPTFQIFLKKKV